MNRNLDNNFLLISYYSKGTGYELEVDGLLKSANHFNIPISIEAIDNRGSWLDNNLYKPKAIINALVNFPGMNIIYVDIDARILQYPKLFDNYNYDIGIFTYYSTTKRAYMCAAGTIFLNNHMLVHKFVRNWNDRCEQNHRHRWSDQTNLISLIKSINYPYNVYKKPWNIAFAENELEFDPEFPHEYVMVCKPRRDTPVTGCPLNTVVIAHYPTRQNYVEKNGKLKDIN